MNPVVCIPTFNEELNIKKCLNKLRWVKKIFILDGKSTDKTIKIANKFKNTKVIKVKKNLDYVSKLNYLLKINKKKWVFILDADYVLSKGLINEVKKINFEDYEKKNIFGFRIKIYNKIYNTIIKEDIYPKKILLFKNNNCYYKKIGHSEKLIIKSEILNLKNFLVHENLNDFKKFSEWKNNQKKYSLKDSKKICETNILKLRPQDTTRRFPPVNLILLFLYLVLIKKIFIYGKAGFYYLFQRLYYELLLSISIIKNYFLKIKFIIRF